MSKKNELKEEDLKKVSGGKKDKNINPDSVPCGKCKTIIPYKEKYEIVTYYYCDKCGWWTKYCDGEIAACARTAYDCDFGG